MIYLSFNSKKIEWEAYPCYDDLWRSKKSAPQFVHVMLRKNCDAGTRETCVMFIDWLSQYGPISLHDMTETDLFEDKSNTITYATVETDPEGNAHLYYCLLSLCRFLTPEYNKYLIKRASPQKIFERVFSKTLGHPLDLHLPVIDHFYFKRLAKENLQHVFAFYSYKLTQLPFERYDVANYCSSGIRTSDFNLWLSKNVTINANVTEKEQSNA